MNDHRRVRESRRAGARILDTAEGVLSALRRYRLDHAFIDIMQTAKRHNIDPVALSDALVALAENRHTNDSDPRTLDVALNTWGHLFPRQPYLETVVPSRANTSSSEHPRPAG